MHTRSHFGYKPFVKRKRIATGKSTEIDPGSIPLKKSNRRPEVRQKTWRNGYGSWKKRQIRSRWESNTAHTACIPSATRTAGGVVPVGASPTERKSRQEEWITTMETGTPMLDVQRARSCEHPICPQQRDATKRTVRIADQPKPGVWEHRRVSTGPQSRCQAACPIVPRLGVRECPSESGCERKNGVPTPVFWQLQIALSSEIGQTKGY